VAIGVDELLEAHVTTANANHKLVVHDLGIDLTSSEHVEALLALDLPDRDVDSHRVDVLSKEFVDWVIADRRIEVLPLLLSWHLGCRLVVALFIGEHRGLLSQSLLEALDDDFLVAEDILERLKLFLFLLQDQLQLFTLVFDLADLALQLAIGLLPLK
jgi:hypothetical protein